MVSYYPLTFGDTVRKKTTKVQKQIGRDNRDGILAERNRIKRRFANPKFKRFVNITQLMMFSNNMEYNDDSPEPLEGAFYAATSYREPVFNYFREEGTLALDQLLRDVTSEEEDFVLKDNNLVSIKHSPEFATNKDLDSPTNRICTSLFSRDRLAFMLRFSIAYVKTEKGIEKHVMRYPQVFATKAIEQTISRGTKKGIIWHTQGSGKTALAFYNVHYLTDYFQKQGVVPKFYFIVDRIDLLDQASREFRSRGLSVHHVSSRDAFAQDIKSNVAIHNDAGKPEITVVNIQRFKDDPDVIRSSDYALGLQRVYFLDEVHRSYNPQGSFLANLNQSDANAIKIGLTGTPLLKGSISLPKKPGEEVAEKQEYNSRVLFGEYIHKYYYNRSIADGYTLRLVREEIETKYKLQLQEVLEQIKVLKNTTDRRQIYAHDKFVRPMLKYIVDDFETSRAMRGDGTTGAMVICDSSDQAKKMAEIFSDVYAEEGTAEQPVETSQVNCDDATSADSVGNATQLLAEKSLGYLFTKKRTVKRHALILHDIGTKSERKEWVAQFKEGEIDILFVYNMLLTGFDANRLKKLYLGRVIKAHNLLQALTRVNRPYKSNRYGYVVDFVDIKSEFKKTNENYFNELRSELGDELENYSNLFKSEDEIAADIETIKDALFHFDTQNAEVFSQQVSKIEDRVQMREVVRALNDARTLYNQIRLSGQYELLAKLDFRKLNLLKIEAANHLQLLNQREVLENADENTNLLNIALEDILFTFRKVSESEMIIADELRETLRRTREGLGGNFDPGDPEFITLKEELERLFKKKKLAEISQEDMKANIDSLNKIDARAKELERKNQLLAAKYDNDEKFARLHKRLMEKGEPTDNERKLFEALSGLKEVADSQIVQNSRILANEEFAKKEMMRLVIEQFSTRRKLPVTPDMIRFIIALVMKEYLSEFHGRAAGHQG